MLAQAVLYPVRHLGREVPHEFQLSQRGQILNRQTPDHHLRRFWIEHDFESKFFQLSQRK
jgi:hypothetical protein